MEGETVSKVDLSFMKSRLHEELLQEVMQYENQDDEINGLMLQGSHARGDAHKNSDLDLYFLLKPGIKRKFHTNTKHGIMIEYKYADYEKAMNKLNNNPMEVYGYLDGRILFDGTGEFKRLSDTAINIFSNFRLSENEIRGLLHWLHSASIKIRSSLDAGDKLKASFICCSTSYTILEGIWGICNKPIPPAGSVIAHIQDVKKECTNIEKWFSSLYTGRVNERINTALEMIDWINTRLKVQ
jgi:hypothetical protein